MKKNYNNNSIFIGAVLIFLAIYLIISRLGGGFKLPVFSLCWTAFLVYVMIRGFKKRVFSQIFIPAALLAWQYDDILHIEAITPWVVLLAAVMLSAGCDMIFKKRVPMISVNGKNGPYSNCSVDENGKLVIDNGMGETTRYLSGEELTEVKIDNGLGKCTVYFEGCTMRNGIVNVEVDNGLGAVQIFCPKEWSINLTQDNALGSVSISGDPSSDPQAPCFNVHVDNGLGSVNITFS